jgi:molybdopterin molybdotransferase
LARLKGFQKLTSLEQALQVFFGALRMNQLKTVSVPLPSALSRILANDVVAVQDLPRFDRSAMDGYAVRAEDTFLVSQFKPKTLQIAKADVLEKKQAMQVWTGNPLPEGADAVVMLEDSKRIKDRIDVCVSVTPGENVSRKGEDIRKGKVAVEAGTRLRPHHLGLLAALGHSEIDVFEKPRIAILATGSELVPIGKRLQKDQVFEVNGLVLSAMCCELGAEPLILGIAKDDIEEISRKLESQLDKADVLLTSGGTSAGRLDLVPDAVNELGKPGIMIHGVAMRPAMPTALGIVREKPIIVLPGNPVAAMIGFEVFVRPLILRLLGITREARPLMQAKMTRGIATTLGKRNFVRVRLLEKDGEFLAEPISARGSAMISTMTKANGYVVVPENQDGLEQGEQVQVHIFGNV